MKIINKIKQKFLNYWFGALLKDTEFIIDVTEEEIDGELNDFDIKRSKINK